MRSIRPLVAAVVAVPLLCTGAIAAASTAQSVAAADRPVSRFVAWQACRTATWQWVAENAEEGTEVGRPRNRYDPALVERQGDGWYVQIAGRMRQEPSTSNASAYCVVEGTASRPRIVELVRTR